MSAVDCAPPQLRSLGWKIHSRCLASRVAQPAVTAMAKVRVTRRGVRFMVETDSASRQKVLTGEAGVVPVSCKWSEMAGKAPSFPTFAGLARGVEHACSLKRLG